MPLLICTRAVEIHVWTYLKFTCEPMVNCNAFVQFFMHLIS
jgi:hypothetical protein